MGYFDKNNNWLLILLVVLNLALLASIWLKPQPSHHSTDIISQFKMELDLTAEQTQQFKNLRKENFEKTKPLHNLIRRNKQSIIEALGQQPPDTLKANQLVRQITRQQQTIEELLVEHYLALKQVCTPQQQQRLNTLFLKAMKPKRPS